MRKWIILTLLAVLVTMSAAQELPWYTSPEDAFDASHKSGKLIFTDVFTTWCSWCKKLDRETFSQPGFREMSDKFVLLKVDGDIYPDFRRKYGVTGYPTMLFLDNQGQEAHNRIKGFVRVDRLVGEMKKALNNNVATRELKWYTTPQEAFDSSKKSGKPIFTDVFTTWCSWCKKLDRETFSDPSFQWEASNFTLLKVDGDIHRDFVGKYGVTGYPTMLFLDNQGNEIHERVKGFRPASTLVPVMEEVSGNNRYSLAWNTDPVKVFELSKTSGKPVFVWASMVGCSWCNKYEQETLSTPGFITMSEKFVLLKVMRAKNSDFMAKYTIRGFPTTMFVNEEGTEIHTRIKGFVPSYKLLPEMETALENHSK